MDKEILGSVPGFSLEFSDNKPNNHKGMKMRFSFKEEFSLASEIISLLQKGVIKEPQHEEENLQFSSCKYLRIPLE